MNDVMRQFLEARGLKIWEPTESQLADILNVVDKMRACEINDNNGEGHGRNRQDK
jgi:hypothetical protein